jgi:two-component system sensor histidine kinase KdpD
VDELHDTSRGHKSAESVPGRGQLRTYLGIAPGVGKTYAMLRDGRAKRRSGVDTVVAYLERHGRRATAAQLTDLEMLPTRTVAYHGTGLEELDVAAVMERRPRLALMDELAHANPPGERHAKRWQDVEELLENGIDVWTTLNVANIESLANLVSRITGVHPAEPVPDELVRTGEIKLVDLAPGALRHRLAQGLVFPKERVDAALSSYFRFANLAALQELAQLWLDDSVPDPASAFLSAHGISEPLKCTVVMVGLEGSAADEWLIRYAAHLAELSDARLLGVHVRAPDNLDRPPAGRLDEDRRLLEELRGRFFEERADDPVSGLLAAARKAAASQLVVGCRHRSPWSLRLKGSTVGRLMRASGDLPVQVVTVGRPSGSSHKSRAEGREERAAQQAVAGSDSSAITTSDLIRRFLAK